MDYLASFTSIAILLVILHIVKVWFSAKRESGEVLLRSKTTHSNRGLQFTSGIVYKFYKSGDMLIINADDISRDRDNYAYFGRELNDEFESTDLFSKFVLQNVRTDPASY